MWSYVGSALGKQLPPSCLAFTLVKQLLCRLRVPWGGHRHLVSQLQFWTRLALCKWMGKGPTGPSWASSAVMTTVLTLDPTPSKGIQEQTGFYFAFLNGNMVVFAMWFLLAVKATSHALCLAKPAAATSSTNCHPHHFVLCISLAFYHSRMSKEKLLAQENPFFSLR